MPGDICGPNPDEMVLIVKAGFCHLARSANCFDVAIWRLFPVCGVRCR